MLPSEDADMEYHHYHHDNSAEVTRGQREGGVDATVTKEETNEDTNWQ